MKKLKLLILIFLMLIVLTNSATVSAQIGGGYDLSWWTVDGGGGQLSGGGYTLTGTIGQPDAANLSGDDYTLSGGFWSRFTAWLIDSLKVYLPLTVR